MCEESKIKSLEEGPLQMKDLTASLGKENMGNNWEAPSEDSIYGQARGRVRRKLTDTEKSSVQLNIQDEEKKQFSINIGKKQKQKQNRKANMTEHLKSH